ncbi:ComEA family DNA-binding protein [Sphingobacterium pedocola]|uniref:Competence protein ComEA n=1 Tax=Sphingobacterium pedocola TaxID=2082722 RepID=A0ABR9T6N3_9SPHI|nr:helix-hairpin-helix domain-containing protein [Sphingobacterium pedocola]MBE8720983.1 competence protein ComEA [Sphingobacterium pedocola]
MKEFFRYFGLTQAEQRGFFVFMISIVIIVFFPFTYSVIRKNDIPESSIAYFQDENKENKEVRDTPVEEVYSAPLSTRTSDEQITYFDFDPNALSIEEWQKLGFSDKQISVIKNYESKGGRFYVKEDLAKIYSISDRDYRRIEPYIKIQKKERNKFEYVATNRAKSDSLISAAPLRIEINQADTSELKKLKGIGPVLSARIVKYRNALGGFCCIAQIGEVYGITTELYEEMVDKIFLESPALQKLNVNQTTKSDLVRHPYISNKEADLIVSYREQHGDYQGVDDLKEIPVLNENFFRKIEPYLQF